MAHLVLARKYRPKRFDQVLGQDLIVSTLKSAINSNRTAHAMLFTGSRGIGKTTIARLMAKALVCLDRKDAEPCNICDQCKAIDNFSSLDVMEIDGASHTGVDDIRDLRESARYQPTSARFKIFIIDEVHMLSISAFNALLKILEEPPAHIVFIFATTEAHKIPKTILSRTQRYDFKRPSIDTIFSCLKSIVEKEKYSFDDDALMLIANLSDGGMRDALGMTEQVLGGNLDHYSQKYVAQILGVVSHEATNTIVTSLINQEIEPALAVLKKIYENGLDLCNLMDSMTERFRILSLCAHVDTFEKAKAVISGLNENDFKQAKSYDRNDLKRLFAMALEAQAQVFQAKMPLFALELFCLRIADRPEMAEASTINFCLQKLDAILHNRPLPNEPIKFLGAKQSLANNDQSEPKKKSFVEPKIEKDFSPDTKNIFKNLIALAQKNNPALSSHLRHARAKFFAEKNCLQLFFDQAFHLEQSEKYLSEKNFIGLIHDQLNQIKINCILNSQQEQNLKSIKTIAEQEDHEKILEEKRNFERASNHPLVKKALEIFGGTICNVKKISEHDVV